MGGDVQGHLAYKKLDHMYRDTSLIRMYRDTSLIKKKSYPPTTACRLVQHSMKISMIGEVPREEKMLYSGTDPESYITEHTIVYENRRIYGNDRHRLPVGTTHKASELRDRISKGFQFITFWQCTLLHIMIFASDIKKKVK